MDEPSGDEVQSEAAEMFEDDARGHSRFGFRSADAQLERPCRAAAQLQRIADRRLQSVDGIDEGRNETRCHGHSDGRGQSRSAPPPFRFPTRGRPGNPIHEVAHLGLDFVGLPFDENHCRRR